MQARVGYAPSAADDSAAFDLVLPGRAEVGDVVQDRQPGDEAGMEEGSDEANADPSGEDSEDGKLHLVIVRSAHQYDLKLIYLSEGPTFVK